MVIIGVRGFLTHTMGDSPSFNGAAYLQGSRSMIGAFLVQVPGAIRGTLVFFFMLFILRILLRNKWVAGGVFVVFWTLIQTLGGHYPAVEIPLTAAIYAIAAIAVVRFGLVTLAVAIFAVDSLGNLPVATNPSLWYFNATAMVMGVIALLAVWAFHASLGGRKLFQGNLLD
jgi:hypothetical protein